MRNILKITTFDSDLFWKNKFGLFSADQVDVKLQFSKGKFVIISRDGFWHHSQAVNDTQNGDLTLEMKVGISPELISWLLGWHQYVTVQSPEELIDIIKSAHQKSLEKYK